MMKATTSSKMVFRFQQCRFLVQLLATQILFSLGFAPYYPQKLHWQRQQETTSAALFATREGGSKTKKGGGNKWDRRRSGKGKKKTHNNHQGTKIDRSTLPRPILANYDDNRNIETNKRRLLRDEINCEHFEFCAGCVVNDGVGNVEIVKTAKRYFSSTSIRQNRIDVQQSGDDSVIETDDDGFYECVVPSDIIHWRTQAKLVVASKSSSWSKDGCIFGLYKKGSHEVLKIPSCQVHHPSINQAVSILEQATQKVGTPGYSKDSQEGGLRYVQLQVERITGKVCLTLVWASQDLKDAQPSLSRLTKELNRLDADLWHSMWCHCNDGPGNNIFTRNPRSWYKLSGMEFLREPLAVGDLGYLYFSPLVFRQGNLDGFDILANDVARAVPGGSKVCELYAGVGLLGLTSLAHHSQPGGTPLTWVRCSDENPANPRCFSRSLSSLPSSITENERRSRTDSAQLTLGELRRQLESGIEFDEVEREGPKVSYLVASAATALTSGQALGADVIIVDPPRKGLEPEVVEELRKPYNPKQDPVESPNLLSISNQYVNWTNDATTLIYVSCGFDALARDCEALLSGRGGWALESATGYVLFPGSNHVETLCIFKR